MSDQLTLDWKSFMMAMLDGAWYSCKHVPSDVASKLQEQDPREEHIVLRKHSETAMFYDLWTKDGWLNEQARLTYIATIKDPLPPVTKQPMKTQTTEHKIRPSSRKALLASILEGSFD